MMSISLSNSSSGFNRQQQTSQTATIEKPDRLSLLPAEILGEIVSLVTESRKDRLALSVTSKTLYNSVIGVAQHQFDSYFNNTTGDNRTKPGFMPQTQFLKLREATLVLKEAEKVQIRKQANGAMRTTDKLDDLEENLCHLDTVGPKALRATLEKEWSPIELQQSPSAGVEFSIYEIVKIYRSGGSNLQIPGESLITIPEEISKISTIQTINLRNNDITVLPNFLAKLPHLRLIRINSPAFTIPEELKNRSDVIIDCGKY